MLTNKMKMHSRSIFPSANYGIILAMKSLMPSKVLLISILSLVCLQSKAQTIFAPMKEAVKAGDASELAKYLNTSIDLNLEGEVNTYSKAQAEFVLRDFFTEQMCVDMWRQHHKRRAKAGTKGSRGFGNTAFCSCYLCGIAG